MLSLDEIRRIGDLARLELSDNELAAMQQELNGILKLVDEMASVDTEGVEPMSHPQAAMQRLREDKVSEKDERGKFHRRLHRRWKRGVSGAQVTSRSAKESLKSLSEKLRAKQVSSVELTRNFLDRIDGVGRDLNAFITVDREKSLAPTKAGDARIAKGEGPR